MAKSEDRPAEQDDLEKQPPLGGLRTKVLIAIAIVAIVAAVVFLVITLTKSDGSPNGTPTDDGMGASSIALMIS